MKKSIGCAALAALFCVSVAKASALTGNVQITSGEADAYDATDGAEFSIYGNGFYAINSTDFVFHLGVQTSISGSTVHFNIGIPGGSSNGNCDPREGSYMGVAAACLQGGLVFSGIATLQPDRSADGTFTASGDIIADTPAYCAATRPPSCTELWDVALEGQGVIDLMANPNNGDFVGVALQFSPPTPTPEPPAFSLLLLGIPIVVLAVAHRSRSTKTVAKHPAVPI